MAVPDAMDDGPREAFCQLLAANGITAEDLKHPERVTHIEMVLDDYCCMRSLRHFTSLQSVCLIQQAICKIEGLDACETLEKLLLNENRIMEITGLGNCHRLKQLHLCSNSISSIKQGMESLANLEVLWLAENKLASLEGLAALPQLKELNVARNSLKSLAGAFEGVSKLKVLNVADNQISSFREVLCLSSTKTLEDLSFSDPDWGDNPICLLCNYNMYVLHHLPWLQVHDCIRISAEDRSNAEAAFARKALFYNMRIKLAKRQAAEGLRAANSLFEALRAGSARQLLAAAKLSKAAEASGYSAAECSPEERKAMEVLAQGTELLDGAQAVLEALRCEVQEELEANIGGLRLELQSSGNVRREVGGFDRGNWAGKIKELVLARFRPRDFLPFGISSLKVESVVQVHNRSLRLRCDDALDRLGPEVKPQFEYLFYVPEPGQSKMELHRVVDECPHERQAGRPLLLTNSIALLEVPRLQRLQGTAAGKAVARTAKRVLQLESGHAAVSSNVVVSRGTLLVCGAYLCDAAPGSPDGLAFPADGGLPAAWPAGEASGTICRVRADDAKEKVWQAGHAELVVPEFLVEVEYVHCPVLEKEPAAERDFGSFSGLLRDFGTFARLASRLLRSQEDSSPSFGSQPPLELDLAASHDGLKVLELQGRGLQRLDATVLQPLVSLERLLLACNELKRLGPLPCGKLTCLDVSFNQLEAMDCLQSLPALQLLDAGWNELQQDAIVVMFEEAKELWELTLRGNPVSALPWTKARALARLPQLRKYDGRELQEQELLAARRSRRFCETTLTEDVVREHVSPPAAGQWVSSVLSLNLQDIGLVGLCNLAVLPNLQTLQLSGNRLTSLRDLGACSRLEELGLEQNCLRSLQGIEGLQALQRLDAGGNELSAVHELQALPALKQLSLEDNLLEGLDSFSRLQSLTELYLSNNMIEGLRTVLLLKPLSQLAVMDLAGNELCSVDDYREYAIFHLKRLKVLDGNPISQADRALADEKFSGKLTVELLEEKLGASSPCYHLRNVDLSTQGIRELGNLLSEELFPFLRELTLDGNAFSDPSTLGPLPKLAVLRMNRTRIDLENGVMGSQPAQLQQLQVLEMGYCGLGDMSRLSQALLPHLRILHMPGNEISRIEGLSGFEQLRELVLDKNRIKQFEEQSFAGLRSLRELRLEDNHVKSLTNLGPLPKLRALHLSINRIAELPELEKLQHLKRLLLLNISSNPVVRKPLHRAQLIQALPSLRAIDGREVTAEEREKVEQTGQVPEATMPGVLFLLEQQAQGGARAAPLLFPGDEALPRGRGPAPRSHSVPRHMAFEQRPPGSGR